MPRRFFSRIINPLSLVVNHLIKEY